MSRILFAAARGARVQESWQKDWEPADLNHVIDDACFYRIHPEDEQLQYGPISTALMVDAKTPYVLHGKTIPNLAGYVLCETPYADRWLTEWRKQTPFERSLALLFLAECFADEGM